MEPAVLWQAVYDSPDDDSPRAVLADALQERDDPRGELIALQLREHAGEASAEAIARARRLVKEAGKLWLGALWPITVDAEMRRGFLHRITLAQAWRSSAWAEILTDPAFLTVEEIDSGKVDDAHFAQVIASGASANLRAITIDNDLVWNQFATRPPPRLERLTCPSWRYGVGGRDYRTAFVESVLPYLEATPRITTIGCSADMLQHLSSRLRGRITGFVCGGELDQVLRLWTELPTLKSFVTSYPNRLELVRVGDRELVRFDARDRLHGATFQRAIELLERFPGTFETVEVIGSEKLANRIRDHHGGRFAVVAYPLPSGVIVRA